MHTVLGHYDLDIDFWFLGFSCLEHISYITASFPQLCLMLDQFLWGHSSRDCDISRFFSESGSVAYQIKGNEVYHNMQ